MTNITMASPRSIQQVLKENTTKIRMAKVNTRKSLHICYAILTQYGRYDTRKI